MQHGLKDLHDDVFDKKKKTNLKRFWAQTLSVKFADLCWTSTPFWGEPEDVLGIPRRSNGIPKRSCEAADCREMYHGTDIIYD